MTSSGKRRVAWKLMLLLNHAVLAVSASPGSGLSIINDPRENIARFVSWIISECL